MPERQIIDPDASQGAKGNRFLAGSGCALPDLAVQHDDIETGGIESGRGKETIVWFPAGDANCTAAHRRIMQRPFCPGIAEYKAVVGARPYRKERRFRIVVSTQKKKEDLFVGTDEILDSADCCRGRRLRIKEVPTDQYTSDTVLTGIAAKPAEGMHELRTPLRCFLPVKAASKIGVQMEIAAVNDLHRRSPFRIGLPSEGCGSA